MKRSESASSRKSVHYAKRALEVIPVDIAAAPGADLLADAVAAAGDRDAEAGDTDSDVEKTVSEGATSIPGDSDFSEEEVSYCDRTRPPVSMVGLTDEELETPHEPAKKTGSLRLATWLCSLPILAFCQRKQVILRPGGAKLPCNS